MARAPSRAAAGRLATRGSGLTVLDKKMIALALDDRAYIERQVAGRMAAVAAIHSTLRDAGAPVLAPAGGHCVLIDTGKIETLRDHRYPLQTFLAEMHRRTGVRAGVHSAGMQKDTVLNRCVRLAVPIGLDEAQALEIARRLVAFLLETRSFPVLELVARVPGLFGEVKAVFQCLQPETKQAASAKRQTPKTDPVEETRAPESKVREERRLEPEPTKEAPRPAPSGADSEIAIIGMSGRYPNAENLDVFWQNLLAGKDCVTETPATRPRTGPHRGRARFERRPVSRRFPRGCRPLRRRVLPHRTGRGRAHGPAGTALPRGGLGNR